MNAIDFGQLFKSMKDVALGELQEGMTQEQAFLEKEIRMFLGESARFLVLAEMDNLTSDEIERGQQDLVDSMNDVILAAQGIALATVQNAWNAALAVFWNTFRGLL